MVSRETAWSRKHRKIRRGSGLCITCKSPAEKALEGHDKCEDHLEKGRRKAREFYKNRVEKGLCARCGNTRNESKTYCDKCLEMERSEYFSLRMVVIKEYGGKCKCCGESNAKFLTIDHIKNDGVDDRKIGRIGAKLYRYIIKHKFPVDRFQLLCFNCNLGKNANGGICPHNDNKDGTQKGRTRFSQGRRQDGKES